jgi:L,D-transpeptidase-like protein
MRRLGSVGFAWLIAFVLFATPLMTAAPISVSAQTEEATPIAEEPPADLTPVDQATPEGTPTPEATELTVEASPVDGSPIAEPTEDETATPEATATETPEFTSSATLADIQITLKCTTSPETVRVSNVGTENIQLTSLTTLIDVGVDEPFALNRTLKPGTTAIFQSGQGAQYGTVLTTDYLFTNSAYENEGVQIETSAGTAVKNCAPKPLPPPPPLGKLSDLKVTLSCTTDPETIRVTNNGAGWITLKGIATYIDPIADEPFAIMPRRVLKPGQTAIYQSGAGAKYGTILTKEFIFTNSAYEKDGVRISTDVGKLYKACPAKPVPPERWIEVNLSAQYLTAWVGNTKVNGTLVSTGRPGFDTPTGTFHILYRYRYETMAGCIQGECYYVPDVPWVQYFTNYGHALHGAYWHNNFGHVMSHGCVNLPLPFAEWLWYWATYGTRVWIHY